MLGDEQRKNKTFGKGEKQNIFQSFLRSERKGFSELESGIAKTGIQVFLTTEVSGVFKTDQSNEMTVRPVVEYFIYLLIT